MCKKLDPKEFKIRVEEIHPLYDFTDTNYKSYEEKVKYKCFKHGIVEGIPSNMLQGAGCWKCGREITAKKQNKTTNDFIEKSIRVHGNKFDYSKSQYIKCDEKILIICNICKNEFNQKASNHLKGAGCPKCRSIKQSKRQLSSLESFIEKAKLVHGDKYNYNKVEYIDSKEKVIIHCNTCDEDFEQQPSLHLQCRGCPTCAIKDKKDNPFGWRKSIWRKYAEKSRNFDSYKVYIIECWNEEERFIKIGRTFTTVKKRFLGKKVMPYNYQIINVLKFNTAEEAFDLETILKSNYKKHKYIPHINFGGVEECFDISIKNYI